VSPVTSADPAIINSLPDHLKPKANMCGSGRIGAFKEKSTIRSVLDRLKKELNRDHIRYALGNDHQLNSEVQSVAVCVGSGSSVLKRAKGADLLVTGEMSHHEILACVAMNKSVVLLEHSASERGFLPTMKQSLVDLIQKDTSIAVKPDIIISQADKEPVEFY
jgi:putative NIF3 family GTP cyclohydrolase 1 type 2